MLNPTIVLSGDIDTSEEVPDTCITPLREMLGSMEVPMTFPVTAKALQSDPRSITSLVDAGCELAGHGDVHTPFTGPVEAQRARLRTMNDVFERVLGFTPLGFRAPYLAHDRNLYLALSLEGFQYDSSQTSSDIVLRMRYQFSARPLAFRDPLKRFPLLLARHIFGQDSFLPRLVALGLFELPVFELDDWFYFDASRGPRLQESEESLVAEIWWRVACRVIKRGEPFTIQAHPKRISPGRLAILEAFVEKAKEEGCEFLTLSHLARRQNKNTTVRSGSFGESPEPAKPSRRR